MGCVLGGNPSGLRRALSGVLGCAERWLPLVEDCEQHLGEFGLRAVLCIPTH